jgi:hypothetical protein
MSQGAMNMPGRAYVVRDADSGPGEVAQVYPYTLKGLTSALEEARFRSFGGAPQVVTVMADGKSRVIRRFEDGRELPALSPGDIPGDTGPDAPMTCMKPLRRVGSRTRHVIPGA